MKICVNKQPLVIFILNFHFYSIKFILEQVREEPCWQAHLVPLLPKIGRIAKKNWQLCYLGIFAVKIGSLSTRLGNFATRLGAFTQ